MPTAKTLLNPNPKSDSDGLAGNPPAEEFWQKFSPRHEFPLSNAVSITLHVVALVGVICLTAGVITKSATQSVPVRGVKIAVDSGSSNSGSGNSGSSAVSASGEESNDAASLDPNRNVPPAELKKLDRSKLSLPPFEIDPTSIKPKGNSSSVDELGKLDEQIKKRLGQGFGKAPGNGAGVGAGQGSSERMKRWTLVFKTSSGEDYLKQLKAFRAKIVIPEPPDWNTNRLFEDPTPNSVGTPLKEQKLPYMYFTDSDKSSAAKVARAFGLDYDPPYFIAFFPKDVEEELAAKEKSFRNRSPEQIESTIFRVIERNGQPVISVIEQTPVKK